MVQNPLSIPGVLGLSQGVWLSLFAPGHGIGWPSAGATAGSLVVWFLVVALVGPARLAGFSILRIGIARSTMLSGLTTMLVLHTPPDLF
ncbi:MAG: iron chelate uptake ABC transporter family permease subunit [Pseudomonadota bacterium]